LGNDRGQLRIAKRFLKLLYPRQKLIHLLPSKISSFRSKTIRKKLELSNYVSICITNSHKSLVLKVKKRIQISDTIYI